MPTHDTSGLKVHNLREVLSTLPMPPNCPWQGVSAKWRCIIVPRLESDNDATLMKYFSSGVPCKLSQERSAPAHAACGPDAFDFITDPRWNSFPKPKIAFKAGWAGPGTEMEDNNYHALVTTFSQIIHTNERGADVPIEGTNETSRVEPDEVLNLQLFHRRDNTSHPSMPQLSQELLWPEFLMDGAACDDATRVSQRGAVTWWHLDDSGEFVMQTGLPIKNPVWEKASEKASLYQGLVDPTRCPTKLFIYGPPDSYDWLVHDDEADVCGKLVALNIFQCPDDNLPDAEDLPILRIAVLEAGGMPLVSPPNIPHAVITLNECVMVEQRRVCNLFLDEVSYLLQKVKYWRLTPIIYDYIGVTLSDENVLCGELLPSLVSQFHRLDLSNDDDKRMGERICASLYALASFPAHYLMPDSSRSSLKSTLSGAPFNKILTPSFKLKLDLHWAVRRFWKKAGCVLSVEGTNTELVEDGGHMVSVVYRDFQPIFGPSRSNLAQCQADYHQMDSHKTLPELSAFLKSLKSKDTDLLDELF
eukprot:GILI01022174.1.p1 GENE.GILI01022174.1~~GILI01022174.1.p1  ORF type:complete len:531 (+),score=39.35 GILI01022174.1:32-1624(+)